MRGCCPLPRSHSLRMWPRSWEGAFLAIYVLARFAGAVGVVSKRLVRKNEKSSCPSPCLSLLLEITRAWRNWQTRMVQVHMGATP